MPAESERVAQRPAWAMVLAVGSMVLFAAMHALVRDLSAELHAFQIAFVRSIVGVAFALVFVLRIGSSALWTRSPKLTLARGALGGVSMTMWFLGLSLLPLVEATALSFTSAIFASLGAVLLLGEHMGARRWSAVAIGFAGMVIMLRPGSGALQLGALVVLGASLAGGVNLCFAKALVRRDRAETVVFWTAVLMSAVSAPLAWYVWQAPTTGAWFELILVGALGSGGMLGITQALRLADASLLIPAEFTRLVWAALFGYVLFAELPDGWTLAGGGLIAVSTLFLALRERQLSRNKSGGAEQK